MKESARVKLLLYFPDLKISGVANNWTTLNRRIANDSFPPGHMIGRRRAWTPREVTDWIESRPSENKSPLKGLAKRAKELRLPLARAAHAKGEADAKA
jgi:predicted DNA-binding transcriptional regulator AlpA